MKRPGMLISAAIAAAMAGPFATSGQQPGYNASSRVIGGGMTVPQGGIGSLLGSMLNLGNTGAGGFAKPRYTNRTGWSCAEARRRAARARNKLRSKGQHRKAVR